MSDKVTKFSQDGGVVQSAAPSESAPARVLSETDSAIADLIKEQPSLAQIESMRVVSTTVPNLLELPDEVLPLHGKKYRYGWLTKDKDLSVAVRTRGWVLCNRTNSPHIKPHRFSTHGGVEQAGMLLAFMPEAQYVQLFERGPGQMSTDRVKHYTEGIFKNQDKNAPVSFYKPEDKGDAD